jgi:hypothetical protein
LSGLISSFSAGNFKAQIPNKGSDLNTQNARTWQFQLLAVSAVGKTTFLRPLVLVSSSKNSDPPTLLLAKKTGTIQQGRWKCACRCSYLGLLTAGELLLPAGCDDSTT